MHISEGVLSAPVLLTGAGLTAVGTAVGLKKIDYDQLPTLGLFASVFFVASLIHVPLGPSSVHLILNGICGLLLGWSAFPAILVGLVLQAVLFQFGGLTVLGVNTFNVAFPAVLLGGLCRNCLHSDFTLVRCVCVFACGACSVLLTAVCVAICLTATGESFASAATLVILAHLPVAGIEGILTVFCVEFIRKVRPEILPANSPA
ncbi:cobalt transporter CbiM [Desulfomonile tiedjei]|uniref:ABC-type Co2+ transport system, permease component n=1 Tax=Desulfomonile tiedjei (strain ATCC 49306 / DSM 6799 / DCB-1) TaxID=706587 RepID=I4C1I9_DESTA|nr:cobalt transporter CbiM [Desulfomonile tiedjei]AFM23430.1 ABC-type Co2+ transport system, permease component [Desulfomonile tiedjei DSM 6799]